MRYSILFVCVYFFSNSAENHVHEKHGQFKHYIIIPAVIVSTLTVALLAYEYIDIEKLSTILANLFHRKQIIPETVIPHTSDLVKPATVEDVHICSSHTAIAHTPNDITYCMMRNFTIPPFFGDTNLLDKNQNEFEYLKKWLTEYEDLLENGRLTATQLARYRELIARIVQRLLSKGFTLQSTP